VLGLSVVRPAVRLAEAIALALLLASCAASPPAGREPQEISGAGTTSPGAIEGAPTPQVLDFIAPRLGGGQVVGSELAGKDVAMFFWAPW
jgi:hypothetical protein